MSTTKKTKKSTRKFRLFPRTLGEALRPAIQPTLKKRGVEATMIEQWSSIVGPALAEQCTPGKCTFKKDTQNGGVLIIHTSSAYALELQYSAPLILEKLAIYYGYRAVDRIKIEQRPLANTPSDTIPNNAKKNPPDDAPMHAKFSRLIDELKGL